MSIQVDIADKEDSEMHWGRILRKSGGIGSLTEGHRPYGCTVSTVMPLSKIILGVMGSIKASEYDFVYGPEDDYISASSLLAASFYLIIEGINQFVDETTNTFIEADNEDFEGHNGKLVCLGIFQLIYTCAAYYPLSIAWEVALSDNGFDGADNFVFAVALFFDAIINIYESIMVMCCKRCCVKTICDLDDCDCCTGSCAYCCVRGGGIEEIAKRNFCYGCFSSSIVPMIKIFLGLLAFIIVEDGNWNVESKRASQAGFVASAGYVISDGVNSFTDQLIEGNILNENGCCLNIAGFIEIVYTSTMVYFMSEAYTASTISDNGYDKHAGTMLLIAFGIDIFVNLYEIFLIFCCRQNVFWNNE